MSTTHYFDSWLLTKDFEDLVNAVHLCSCFQERLHTLLRTFDGFRYLIDVLRLHNSFQIIFQDFCEIIYLILVWLPSV